MFCKSCRHAFTGQSNKPRSQSIVRQTIDNKHWDTVKAQVIARDGPICQNHRRHGRFLAFSGQQLQLDHIVPQEANPDRIWDLSNLENLCAACHARKTLEESGLSADARRGLMPLRITWDFRPDVWVASGWNGSKESLAAFVEATGVQETYMLPADRETVLEACKWADSAELRSFVVLCSRESQYELGKTLRARFFKFLGGLNV